MAVIDKTYHKLLTTILKDGFKYEDPNRKGINRLQIPSYIIEHNFSDGFPAITTKKLYWKGIVGELLWFLRGDTNIKYLIDNGINIWNKDAYNYYKKISKYHNSGIDYKSFIDYIKKGDLYYEGCSYELGDLGRVYGAQWGNWNQQDDYDLEYRGISQTKNGIDQFSNLIKGLKENPMGTKHIVTAWNPAELSDMALPPCHWSFEILVEPINIKDRIKMSNRGIRPLTFLTEEKEYLLNKDNIPVYQFTLKWHQRSVDTFLGLPFNIASYALLAQIIGKMTNMVPKGIIGDLSNVHIYEPHLDSVKEQLSRNVDKYNNCDLDIDYDVKQFLEGFNEVIGSSQYSLSSGYLDKVIEQLEIKDFKLKNYNSYPAIKEEMLAYNK